MAAGEIKSVCFMAKTNLSWQIWKEDALGHFGGYSVGTAWDRDLKANTIKPIKETLPDLHWFLERNFNGSNIQLKYTGDEKSVIVEMEMPIDSLGKLEKAFKDNSLSTEIDKIHGFDPATHGKRDCKLSRFSVMLGPTRPQNIPTNKTIEGLEEQILKLEQLERTRSIDLKAVMEGLQSFQLEIQKRLDELDRKFFETTQKIETKCDRLEKTLARYRK
ncbi:hypothetical protein HDU96_003060 [Phlyctochytrium bullatum]|nr:hypothetical protein HDU96_003060 [Phlyctochytrium bullatum]